MTDDFYNPSFARMRNRNGKAEAYVRAPKQEKETVSRLGGRAIPASGSKFRKGDAEISGVARIECKSTSADSFRVTRGMFETLERAGRLNDQVPMIVIEFLNKAGKPEYEASVIKTKDLITLIQRLHDAEGTQPTDKRSVLRSKQHHNRIAKNLR